MLITRFLKPWSRTPANVSELVFVIEHAENDRITINYRVVIDQPNDDVNQVISGPSSDPHWHIQTIHRGGRHFQKNIFTYPVNLPQDNRSNFSIDFYGTNLSENRETLIIKGFLRKTDGTKFGAYRTPNPVVLDTNDTYLTIANIRR